MYEQIPGDGLRNPAWEESGYEEGKELYLVPQAGDSDGYCNVEAADEFNRVRTNSTYSDDEPVYDIGGGSTGGSSTDGDVDPLYDAATTVPEPGNGADSISSGDDREGSMPSDAT